MIPHDDRGLTLGDGLFETLLARDGELVLFDEHLARMTAGCAVLGLPPPDPAEARRLCEEVINPPPEGEGDHAQHGGGGLSLHSGARTGRVGSAASLPSGVIVEADPLHHPFGVVPLPLRGRIGISAVRLTLTAGSGGRGLDRPAEPRPRLFATASPYGRPKGPVALTTVSIRRNEGSPASRLKTLSYLDPILARREAGPNEALMLNNRGEVACAAAANVFWLAGGVLFTPALACGVLDGIMRGQVLAAAGRLGLAVGEAAAPRAALDGAQAIFLTNSLMGLRRVDSLDGKPLGDAPQVSALAEALGPVSWT